MVAAEASPGPRAAAVVLLAAAVAVHREEAAIFPGLQAVAEATFHVPPAAAEAISRAHWPAPGPRAEASTGLQPSLPVGAAGDSQVRPRSGPRRATVLVLAEEPPSCLPTGATVPERERAIAPRNFLPSNPAIAPGSERGTDPAVPPSFRPTVPEPEESRAIAPHNFPPSGLAAAMSATFWASLVEPPRAAPLGQA